MLTGLPCEALRKGVCLELRYDGYGRVVEVHAVGTTKKNKGIMRAWQVWGGSVSNEPVGWKLLSLDDIVSAHLTEERSLAPRKGYNRNDPAIERFACRIEATAVAGGGF